MSDDPSGGFFERMAGRAEPVDRAPWDPQRGGTDGGEADGGGTDAGGADGGTAAASSRPDATVAGSEPPSGPPPGRFDHEPPGDPTPPRRSRDSRPVLVGVVALVSLVGAALWWLVGSDDPDVAVAGSTTVRAVPSSGAPSPSTTVSATTVVDPVLSAAYAAEVERACGVIRLDPGLPTEAVQRWDPAWLRIGRSEVGLYDEINNCALPARDAAMAAMGAREEEERRARVAACGRLDRSALEDSPGQLVGRCGVLGVRVEKRAGSGCELLGAWDAAGEIPGDDAPVAVFRSGSGDRCPLIEGLRPGWSGRVWATVRGVTERDGRLLAVLAVEQAEARG